jgi:hypothetical protein
MSQFCQGKGHLVLGTCGSQIICVIPATQEAEIRRIVVQSQPREIVHKILSQNTQHKNRADRVAQGIGLEFKPQ